MDYFEVERQKLHSPDSMNHKINSNVKSKFKWLKSTTCLVWNLTIVPQLSTLHHDLAVMNLWLVINIALDLNSVETAGMFVGQVVGSLVRAQMSKFSH